MRNFSSEQEMCRFFDELLTAQGVGKRTKDIKAFQAIGSIDSQGAEWFFNFQQAKASTYVALKHDNWFFGNLWLNPYISDLSAGTPSVETDLLTHDKNGTEIKFEVDLRYAVVGQDLTFPSRLYFEDVFITGLRITNDEPAATYKLPYIFTGYKISLR